VLRGKWILENLLGSPPPPPPPNVPQLRDPDSGKPMSVREAPGGASQKSGLCELPRVMDPPGFALENYDAGRTLANHDVERRSTLPEVSPGGENFAGTARAATSSVSRPSCFVGTVTEKLMTFALGRGLESYDAPAVRTIVREAAGQDYRFSALVLGIVNSAPFGMRRTL
jgi:hypothetical protein